MAGNAWSGCLWVLTVPRHALSRHLRAPRPKGRAAMTKAMRRAPWLVLAPLLVAWLASAALNCSSSAQEAFLEAGTDAPADAGAEPSDAANLDVAMTALQGVGSKCLTKCPQNLM